MSSLKGLGTAGKSHVGDAGLGQSRKTKKGALPPKIFPHRRWGFVDAQRKAAQEHCGGAERGQPAHTHGYGAQGNIAPKT